jgi:tetratricopeptide (TPR) repeat protein
MRKLFYHFCPNVFRPFILLAGWLLLYQPLAAAPAGPDLPPDLQTRLQRFRNSDDLQNWIYDQLQWVAQQPGPRSQRLITAVSESWRTPRTDEESQAWLDLLINEGYSLLRAGDIVRSTDAYTAAWQWARNHPKIADNLLLLNNILKPLGNNYTRLGDYEAADFIHHKALTIATALGDKEALAGTYSNLANTASNRGRLTESVEYCKLGLLLVPAHSPYRGLLLSEEADALNDLGQTTAARTTISQAIAVLMTARPGPEVNDWLFVAYQQAGDIDSAHPFAALHDYLAALEIEKKREDSHGAVRPRETAKLYLRLGELCRRLKQPGQALGWLDRCLAVLIPGKTFPTLRSGDLYAENTLADVLYSRALLYSGNNVPMAFTCFRYSFATEGLLRRQLITAASKENAVADSRLRHETAIETAWEAWSATNSPAWLNSMLEFMESSKAQLLLDEQQQHEQERNRITPASGDSLQNRIRMLQNALIYYQEQSLQATGNDSITSVLLAQRRLTELDLAATRKAASVKFRQSAPNQPFAQDTLPNDHTEIRSFFAGDCALFQVAVDHNGVHFAERLPLGSTWGDSLRQFLHVWFEQSPKNMIDRPRSYFDQAYALYHELFAKHPFKPGIHYIIIPDGALDLLPVEALPTESGYRPSPADWPLVVRRNTISYAWSIRTWIDAGRSTGNPTGFAGFFLADNSRHLPSLKSVTGEEEGIAQSIDHGQWFTAGQATFPAFENSLQQAAVVHISSHAFSGRDTGSVPQIELNDRPFYIFQLSDMPRHPALVVLSACRTGDGRMVAGEGAQSMARAFTSTGTNGVITGWWNVHDEAAARLMELFYQQLQRQAPAAEALCSAKLSWLQDPAIPYVEKLPWYWAALNYQGTTAALPAGFYASARQHRALWPWLIWCIGIFTILLLAAWWVRR